MRGVVVCSSAVVLCALGAMPVAAQESPLRAEFRLEAERLKKSCGAFTLKAIGGCAMTVATAPPVHLALGNLAPQNGFGLGAAFVTHYTPNESWRLSWNADAVASFSGAWRAGAYMKSIHTPVRPIGVVSDPAGGRPSGTPSIHPYTVINAYVQATSLDKLFFFGLGPDSRSRDRAVFGLRQTIVGADAIVPITAPPALSQMRLALLGEANGRFVDLNAGDSDTDPTVGQLHTEATAPGLTEQPAFLQLGEGIRASPSWMSNRLQANYLLKLQHFLTPGESRDSFRRWTLDLQQDVPLYRDSRVSRPLDTNGPDECGQGPGTPACPSISRNRQGTASFRLLLSASHAAAGGGVPFYFQPTLGGSDINGDNLLGSYQDYRFRGPNLVLLRESFEHSIYGPVGFSLVADQGKVAQRGDLNFRRLTHSFAAGLTVRAGGLPQATVSVAWGGPEGRHFVVTMSSSLLGGSSRPSLY